VGYPLLPVGPNAAGGAEQILYLVDRGLVRRGWHSIVIAARGSSVDGELIESPACKGEMTEEVRKAARCDHLRLIEQTLDQYPVDLLHFHGLDFFNYLPSNRVRKIATLHLPCAWYPDSVFAAKDVELVCVSDSQARSAPQPALPVIRNGIDTAQFSGKCGERKHLLWLGRICPEKGVHIALEVARELDAPLVVAGPVHRYRDHEVYFAEKVQPLLDRKRRYAGPVGLSEKIRLLGEAFCLLIPSLVEETSSLVAMEAISSGTPVVAYRSGALPEIVEHGVTGFVVDSQQQMAEAVRRVVEISSNTCRQHALACFEAARMVEDYVRLYAAQ